MLNSDWRRASPSVMPASAKAASSMVLSTGRSTTTSCRASPPRGNVTARARFRVRRAPQSRRVTPISQLLVGHQRDGHSRVPAGDRRLAALDDLRVSRRRGPLDFEERCPAEQGGLLGEVRDAIVDEVRADVEKHEQKRHQRKRDEQEEGHRADEDVGEDEPAAYPPEQPERASVVTRYTVAAARTISARLTARSIATCPGAASHTSTLRAIAAIQRAGMARMISPGRRLSNPIQVGLAAVDDRHHDESGTS